MRKQLAQGDPDLPSPWPHQARYRVVEPVQRTLVLLAAEFPWTGEQNLAEIGGRHLPTQALAADFDPV